MRRKCLRPFGFGRRTAFFCVAPPPRCAPASRRRRALNPAVWRSERDQIQFFSSLLDVVQSTGVGSIVVTVRLTIPSLVHAQGPTVHLVTIQSRGYFGYRISRQTKNLVLGDVPRQTLKHELEFLGGLLHEQQRRGRIRPEIEVDKLVYTLLLVQNGTLPRTVGHHVLNCCCGGFGLALHSPSYCPDCLPSMDGVSKSADSRVGVSSWHLGGAASHCRRAGTCRAQPRYVGVLHRLGSLAAIGPSRGGARGRRLTSPCT
jgi:hypothetical protein